MNGGAKAFERAWQQDELNDLTSIAFYTAEFSTISDESEQNTNTDADSQALLFDFGCRC